MNDETATPFIHLLRDAMDKSYSQGFEYAKLRMKVKLFEFDIDPMLRGRLIDFIESDVRLP